ncbi:hypothetical protein KVV02_008322 [Mortierella alpina]|uniref:Uncharacterized protein n=1 Tax=Mortierella alpina TaxID=64518 RepID=A0A9P7ZZM6_MORAP|nr:hypothetical protein KVV02_008322 [Mortierella alpina]
MTVLRPLPNHQGYGLYSKGATLKALGLPTEKHLALLATVSNNDFSKNIRGLGFARNTDIIERIPSSTSAAMLDHYCAVAATKVSTEVAPNGAAELERIMHMRVAMKAQRAKSLMTSPPFYVARKSHPNQFRPVIQSNKSILAVRKYSDATKSKLHDHQLPLRIPGPRPRPPAAKRPIVRKARKGKKKTKPSEKKRQLRSAVVDDHQLRSRFQTKALTIGSVTGRIVDMGLDRQKAEILRRQLQAAVFLLNDIQLRAYYATAIYITHLLENTPPNSPTRIALLNQIIDDAGFMYNLGRMLYHGGASGKGGYAAKATSTRPVADSAKKAYSLFSEMTKLPPLKQDVPDIPFTAMSDMAMVSVQAALRSHYRNCVFEGHPNPDPDGVSDIDHFFSMNTSGQYCDFPKAKLATGFVFLSETVLLDIFYARDDTKKIIQDILCELGQEDRTMNKKKEDGI